MSSKDNNNNSNSPSEGSESDNREEIIDECNDLIATAKDMADQCDYDGAAEILSGVLEKMTSIYGESSIECRDAYMLYSKCLFMSVKNNNGIEAVISKAKEKVAEAAKSGALADPKATAKDVIAAALSSLSGGDSLDDDAEGDLETAWDCLELARVITEREEPGSIKLSDVLVDIGEISLENGFADRALKDYERALELRKAQLPVTDRRIAEGYYMVGMAQSMLPDKLENARDSFVLARRSLEERMAALPKGDKEIKELQQLIDDIAERMEDLEASANAPGPEEIRKMLSGQAPEPIKKDTETKPVADLGVVGKVKRDEAKEPETKKQKR